MKTLLFIYRFFEKRNRFYIKYKPVYFIVSLGSLLFWVFAFKSSVLDANNIPTGSMTPTLKIGDLLFVNKMRYSFKLPFSDIKLFEMDQPQRGDIVTFTPPDRAGLRGKTLVKRVVGVPGDLVEVFDGEVIVSGVRYPVTLQKDRTSLKDLDYPRKIHGADIGDFQLFKERVIDPKTKKLFVEHYIMKVDIEKILLTSKLRSPLNGWSIPEGYYMVMGDNRDDSEDSRVWGLIPRKRIHGKVFMVYFSVNWGFRFVRSPTQHDDLFSTNPLVNLFESLMGKYPHVYVRWDRIGKRLY